MEKETIQEITQKAVEAVQVFFTEHMNDEKVIFPEVLQSTGIWIAICADGVLAIFFLNEKAQQRINLCKQKGVHPFPGFMIGESERPSKQRATYSVSSPFRFYSSKQSSDTFAFALSGGASCIVMDHIHEVVSKEGNRGSYTVDLAFMLGCGKEALITDLESRLSSLLDYCLDLWRLAGD